MTHGVRHAWTNVEFRGIPGVGMGMVDRVGVWGGRYAMLHGGEAA